MAEIVQLPDRGDRTWAKNAAMLAGIAIEGGHDPEAVAVVIAELKPLFLDAWQYPSLTSGPDLNEGVNRLNDWVRGFSSRLLIMTLFAKLELREARSPGTAACHDVGAS